MDRNKGISIDPLFVGLTRPPMIWGVTYSAMLINVVLTMESFIITKNLVWLLAFVPIHGVFYLVCMYEPRFFDLLQVWGRTRLMAFVIGTLRYWKSNSYSPLVLDLPDAKGRRKAMPGPVVV